MSLSNQDRADITDLINLHGHLADAQDLDGHDELFTPDVSYDLEDFGLGIIRGLPALREVSRSRGGNQPVGHHVTNIVISAIDDQTARVRSKGIGIMANGNAGSVRYDDVVVRRPTGWKISSRKATAQRTTPTSGSDDGPRAILHSYRQAAIDQSVDAMRELYAADAVHEFPFSRPGLPSRLEGRDEILGFITQSWRDGPLKYDSYRTIAIHDTGDPQTIIAEQEVVGASTTTGDFVLPNIVVLTTAAGKITTLRDYVNVAAAAVAIGRYDQPSMGTV